MKDHEDQSIVGHTPAPSPTKADRERKEREEREEREERGQEGEVQLRAKERVRKEREREREREQVRAQKALVTVRLLPATGYRLPTAIAIYFLTLSTL